MRHISPFLLLLIISFFTLQAQRNPVSGIYAIWYSDNSVFRLPYIQGGQSVTQWQTVQSTPTTYNFSSLDPVLSYLESLGLQSTIQVNANLHPTFMFNIIPYHPEWAEGQTGDPEGVLMYWHTNYISTYTNLVEAYGNYFNSSPFDSTIVGMRLNYNPIGTEDSYVQYPESNASTWTVPPGVINGSNWTQAVYNSYAALLFNCFLQSFTTVRIFSRTDVATYIDFSAQVPFMPPGFTYGDYFSEGIVGIFQTGAEAEPYQEGADNMFYTYCLPGYTVGYAETWSTAFAPPPYSWWAPPTQWNYWLILNDLSMGISFQAIYGSDLHVALDGFYMGSYIGQPNAFVGGDYKIQFNDALEFGSKYAGYSGDLANSPGVWIAFRVGQNPSLPIYNVEVTDYIMGITLLNQSDTIGLDSRYEGTAVPVIPYRTFPGQTTIGPYNQRFGAWARIIPQGVTAQLQVDSNFLDNLYTASIVTINVTYLDNTTGAFSVSFGTQTVTTELANSGIWQTVSMPVLSPLTTNGSGAQIELLSINTNITFHMVELTRQQSNPPQVIEVMPGRLEFYTAPTSQSDIVERMRISSTGFIGIGTTDPFASVTLDNTAYPFSLTQQGIITTTQPGFGTIPTNGCFVIGKYAYVIGSGNKLAIFNINNPTSIIAEGTIGGLNNPIQLFVNNNIAYVLNSGNNTLQTFNVANPNSISLLGSISTSAMPTSFFVRGIYAYVLTSNGIQIYDVSNPASMIARGAAVTASLPSKIFVEGIYAYVINTGVPQSLQAFNIHDPNNIIALGALAIPGNAQPLGLFVRNNIAYITDNAHNLELVNVSNPTSLSLISTTNLSVSNTNIFVYDNLLYGNSTAAGLIIVNVANTAAPVTIFNDPTIFPLWISGNFIYATDAATETMLTIKSNQLGLYAHSAASIVGDVEVNNELNVGHGSLFVDGIAGQVGVNTTVPGAALEINGNAIVSKNVTVIGNIYLPGSSTSTAGNIMKENMSFIHNFGINNTFFGESAGNFVLTGTNNTGIGNNNFSFLTSGSNNVAVGYQALRGATSGSNNVGVGYHVLRGITTGNNNTAVGTSSLVNISTASHLTAIGAGALENNTSGSPNTAVGYNALTVNTSGSKNVAVGDSALTANTTGSGNIAIGSSAGSVATGSNNIYIGNVGVAAESSIIRIGTSSNQTACYVQGINGETITGPGTAVIVDVNGKLGTVTSSLVYKHDIQSMGDFSSNLMKVKPVTFKYLPELDESQTQYPGFIAEELAEKYPDLVTYDNKGNRSIIHYHVLSSMLLNELQKAVIDIESLEEEVRQLITIQ